MRVEIEVGIISTSNAKYRDVAKLRIRKHRHEHILIPVTIAKREHIITRPIRIRRRNRRSKRLTKKIAITSIPINVIRSRVSSFPLRPTEEVLIDFLVSEQRKKIDT